MPDFQSLLVSVGALIVALFIYNRWSGTNQVEKLSTEELRRRRERALQVNLETKPRVVKKEGATTTDKVKQEIKDPVKATDKIENGITSKISGHAEIRTEESDTGSTRREVKHAKKQTPSAKNKKRAPPVQILCEALTEVTGLFVNVTKGDGTWGGEKWKRRRTVRDAVAIELPLIQYRLANGNPESLQDEWVALEVAFQGLLENDNPLLSYLFPKGLWQRHSVKQAILWHTRAWTALRDFRDGDEADKLHLETCMRVLSSTVVEACAKVIIWDDGAMSSTWAEAESSEVNDLFSYDYGVYDDFASVRQPSTVNNGLDELLSLMESFETVVTKSFMSGLIASESSVNMKHGTPYSLSDCLLLRSLERVPPVDKVVKPVLVETMMQSLTLVSNLLSLSPDATRSLLVLIQTEISEDRIAKLKSAREFQMASPFNKLMQIAAYSVPDAGAECVTVERNRQALLSQFQHAARGIENYPICVFMRHRSHQMDTVMINTRKTMCAARDSCTIILKRLMLVGLDGSTSVGKKTLFRWIRVVVEAK